MRLVLFFLFISFTLQAQPSGKISMYLTWKEALQSNHSIPNIPSKEQQEKIKKFGKECFDKIRVKAGSPIYVSSLFRSPALNKAVQGAKYSDHQVLDKTVACDIDQDGRGKIGNRALFFLIMHNFEFKKLIWEGDNPIPAGSSSKAFPSPRWIHISYSTDPEENKAKRVYRMVKRGNKTVYLNFATSGIN
jgi:zinc D-Ala-D-Ala carboxypeptidase